MDNAGFEGTLLGSSKYSTLDASAFMPGMNRVTQWAAIAAGSLIGAIQ